MWLEPRWKQSVDKWLPPGFRILLILLKTDLKERKLPGGYEWRWLHACHQNTMASFRMWGLHQDSCIPSNDSKSVPYQQNKNNTPTRAVKLSAMNTKPTADLWRQLEKLRARPWARCILIKRMEKPLEAGFPEMVQLRSHFTDWETGVPWGLESSMSSQKMRAFLPVQGFSNTDSRLWVWGGCTREKKAHNYKSYIFLRLDFQSEYIFFHHSWKVCSQRL